MKIAVGHAQLTCLRHRMIVTLGRWGRYLMKAFDKPLTAAQERCYLELFHKGDKGAKEILIEKNLRLVAHMVNKYACSE